MADSVYHWYLTDYQGNICGVVNTETGRGEQYQEFYPYGKPHDPVIDISDNRRKFGGKELLTDKGYDAYDFEARPLTITLPRFTQPDPLAETYYPLSIYVYCAGDPVNFVDPTGMNYVYDIYGKFLGATSEGFTGDIMIYSGTKTIEWSKYTVTQAQATNVAGNSLFKLQDAERLGVTLSGQAVAKIFTHIISQWEGKYVYDEKFSMKRISGGEISYYEENDSANFLTLGNSGHSKKTPTIYVCKGFLSFSDFEPTVENIMCVVLVHEWYSHGIKLNGNRSNSHRLAYKNVINFKPLWNLTTSRFKAQNLFWSQQYTLKETKRVEVDKPYRRLYKGYSDYMTNFVKIW